MFGFIVRDIVLETKMNTTETIMKTIEPMRITLGEYVNEKIYSGIRTGFNKAFVIDGIKRVELVAKDPKSAEIIKPLTLGNQVQKWYIQENEKWLIFPIIGININHYPAIKEHLEQWKEDLSARLSSLKLKRKSFERYQWYEIQDNVAYYQTFETPKIVYPNVTK